MITKSQRYREILAVLARHGIGIIDDEFIRHEAGDKARAEHLRRACEELGTMFIKLGQILSTRGDLFPDAYTCLVDPNRLDGFGWSPAALPRVDASE